MALQLRDGPLVPVWSGHHQARPYRAMREHFGLLGDGAIWLHVGTLRDGAHRQVAYDWTRDMSVVWTDVFIVCLED